MAAPFAMEAGNHVVRCENPSPAMTAPGTKVLGEFKPKQHAKRLKRGAEERSKSRQTTIRKTLDPTGRAAVDAAFARYVAVTGQSLGVGTNPYIIDYIDAICHDPAWRPHERQAQSTTDLDDEDNKVNSTSRANMEELDPALFVK